MKKISKLLLCSAAMFSLVGCGNKKNNNNFDVQPLSFEEQYLSKNMTYAEGGKFAISMISNIATICAGVGFDSPTAVVSGAFGILTSINDQFNGNKGPTIANVMNKLGEMDQKLDQLDQKLDRNYSELSKEIIRTQAKVDQVYLEQQNEAMKLFNTNYVEKIEDYQRNFSDYLEQSFKSYVNTNQEVNIHMEKVSNEWTMVSLLDTNKEGTRDLKLEIRDFPKTRQFLKENYNIVSTGFMDKLCEDIDSTIDHVQLPENLKDVDARNMIIANTIENFTKEYYVNNHDKALELRNLVINYSKQVSGKAVESILDTYSERMKYMFNFAGEMKEHVYGAYANIEHALDVNTALAAEACLFAGVNGEEVRSEFLNARAVLKNRYESARDLADNYCFSTNTKIGSGFYRARFNTKYTNTGNTPKFTANLGFDKVIVKSSSFNFVEDNPYQHSYLTEVDHLRIKTRMDLMKLSGLDVGENYIDYLKKVNVVASDDYTAFTRLKENQWLSDDALRFFTGLTIRDLNDKDRTMGMQCVAKGNPDGNYFNIGWTGKYKSAHDAECWKGKIAETTYIDALTGEAMEDKKVCAYATYSESHWYWADDEYWAFVDNAGGNYFFILENVA